jgi:hypothetical protein
MLNADDWKIELRTGLSELMDRAVRAGASADQIFDAVTGELQTMKEAWEQDPDPADDPKEQILEEPANDWPGAER